ncbi:hypothetical protein HK100_007324 [Physocladia obscura]|uniref:Uncharacterized protein n=1 Tax=Physocladia obscura TaxID=109957 RepID=A0AAD5XB77_9FUNG|nr:hypothetical protein HK100_007324 [Physocladia obscura]
MLKDLLVSDPYSNSTSNSTMIWDNFKVELTYHSVFLAAIGFWLFIMWNAVMHQNTIQVWSINCFNIGLLVYSALQIIQTNSDLKSVQKILEDKDRADDIGYFLAAQIILPCIFGLFIPVYAWLSYKLTKEFDWRMYRITGGVGSTNSALRTYFMHQLFMKFSIFFGSGFLILDLVLTSVSNTGIILIPIIGSIIGLVAGLSGYYGARRSSFWLIITHCVCCIGSFAYVIVRVHDAFSRGGAYLDRAKIPLVVYAVTTECLLIATVVYAVLVFRNFWHRKIDLTGVLDKEQLIRSEKYTRPATSLDD